MQTAEGNGMDHNTQTPMKGAVRDAVGEQVGREFYAAYLYLSMSGYFETASLTGFAYWMRKQYEEEAQHALKLFDSLLDRGERVQLPSVDQPPSSFRSPLDAFEQALEHEKEVTAHIHELYDLAILEKDYPAKILLDWFVQEQVEEEKAATEIVERLKMAGEDGAALLMLDKELGERQ
jgi:ferritin